MGKAERVAAKQFKKLTDEQRLIVVYAEGRGDWAHLGPVIEVLLGVHDCRVTYLTSELDDPILLRDDPRLVALHIGDGVERTLLFRDMKAGLLVTTVPDLETYQLKRSLHPVHYVYLFHAFVSTHMVYRPKAFDAFDTVFCVGPHHAEEIRATEQFYGLPKKRLVKHGYGRVDLLMEEAAARPARPPLAGRAPTVLLAGSWGDDALMENSQGRVVIQNLISAGHEVIVRLHPMTVRHHPGLSTTIAGDFPTVRVETDMRSRDSLFESDVMVSDWSGASFDYAFGLGKPVVYVDMPQKVNNPDYGLIGVEPVEVRLRSEIGGSVALDDLDGIADAVETATHTCGQTDRLGELREEWIYNVGHSATTAAGWIATAASKLR